MKTIEIILVLKDAQVIMTCQGHPDGVVKRLMMSGLDARRVGDTVIIKGSDSWRIPY